MLVVGRTACEQTEIRTAFCTTAVTTDVTTTTADATAAAAATTTTATAFFPSSPLWLLYSANRFPEQCSVC